VGAAGAATAAAEPPAHKAPLAAHIERAVARLTTLRSGGKRSAEFAGRVDATVRELDHLAADARAARGDRRAVIVDRLQALDGELLEAAMKETETDASVVATLNREAEMELAPFISRMPQQALDRAHKAAFQRLLRDAVGLPVLAYE